MGVPGRVEIRRRPQDAAAIAEQEQGLGMTFITILEIVFVTITNSTTLKDVDGHCETNSAYQILNATPDYQVAIQRNHEDEQRKEDCRVAKGPVAQKGGVIAGRCQETRSW